MRFLLGLTGSIGMGKTTTAQMLADRGCKIWDADAAVARLYQSGGAAVAPLQRLNPKFIENGAVSKTRLKKWIAETPFAFETLEAIVHPLVAEDRRRFIEENTEWILVFDIPLLFENGASDEFDATATVYCDEQTQRARVMARGTMTEEIFAAVKEKQMPTIQKTQMADFVIPTDTMEIAAKAVDDMLAEIRVRMGHA